MGKPYFYKELTLPEQLEPNSVYFISGNEFAETYITDQLGNPRKVGNSDMIKSLIAQSNALEIPQIKSFQHIQSSPSAIWLIVNILDFNPNITVVDSSGSVVYGSVTYESSNIIKITFSGAFSGVAYAS